MKTKLDTSHIENLSTLLDFMRWGASQFVHAELSYSHGLSSPLDESVYLILRTLHLPVDTPEIYWQSKLTTSEIAGLQFYVDERALIPRSPIAELVESQFTPWVNPDEVESVLDLCTGCGCIGIACAYAFPQATIDLSDLSEDALAVAKINIDKHDAKNRIMSYQSDLFDFLLSDELKSKQYDIIVSNPPYVDEEDMAGLAEEFKHEPELALSSGVDGLEFTKKLLNQAANFLTDQGVLVVEVGNSQYELAESYPDVPFQWIDFERGGDGVFILTKQDLNIHF